MGLDLPTGQLVKHGVARIPVNGSKNVNVCGIHLVALCCIKYWHTYCRQPQQSVISFVNRGYMFVSGRPPL